jgi:hypothetical protein
MTTSIAKPIEGLHAKGFSNLFHHLVVKNVKVANPLAWWKKNEIRFPLIGFLACWVQHNLQRFVNANEMYFQFC